MAKSAREHLASDKQPKTVVLDGDFAGVKKGQTLFVATPAIVDAYIRKIPRGETRTIVRMRRELARKHKCDATCPVSSAIFIRISAQAAIDEMEEGTPASDVAPFWRLLTGTDKIASRLSIDPAWIDRQRESEQV